MHVKRNVHLFTKRTWHPRRDTLRTIRRRLFPLLLFPDQAHDILPRNREPPIRIPHMLSQQVRLGCLRQQLLQLLFLAVRPARVRHEAQDASARRVGLDCRVQLAISDQAL